MKKVGFIILYVLGLALVVCGIGYLLLSSTYCNNHTIDTSEIIFSGNLRTDYELSCIIKQTPEGSGWRYTIEINPIDEGYRYDKQPQIISFLSDVKLENLVETPDTEYPDEIILTAPELGLRITHSNIEVDNNFGLYCPGKDLDEFILIPGGEGNISNETIERDNSQYQLDAYQFMGPVKYINHYKNGDIAMFFERGYGSGLIIDDAEKFGKNCIVEIGEIENFLPLNLPFELKFDNFDYATIGFIKELSNNSDCLSSHKLFSPHNNYMSFYTEDMACQLWYETGTTLESITFDNALKNITF